MVDQATHDYVTWRTELESVEDLGAFGTLERNLITGQGGGEPVSDRTWLNPPKYGLALALLSAHAPDRQTMAL